VQTVHSKKEVSNRVPNVCLHGKRSIAHLKPLLILIPFKHWEVCDPEYFMGSLLLPSPQTIHENQIATQTL
jgi:hypothetical protein